MIEVIEAANSHRMTTPERVISDLNLSSPDVGYIGRLIDRASSVITEYTGRTFAKERVREDTTSDGDYRLVLERTPIREVHEVLYNDAVVDADSYHIEHAGAGFLWMDHRWRSTRIYHHWLDFHKTRFYRQRWTIEYTAGYNMPGSPDRDLPYDIEGVCLDLVSGWYQSRQRDPGVRSEKVGDSQVQFFATSEQQEARLLPLARWMRLD